MTGAGPWRIGEVTRRTGLSARALRHYEALGLARPAGRTESGQRLYDADGLRALYAVKALRQLGFGLAAIRTVLSRPDLALPTVARAHLAAIEARRADLARLAGGVSHLLDRLDAAEAASADDILNLLEAMRSMDEYFTPAQREGLARRAGALGADGMRRAEAAWADILAAAERARAAGTPPQDPAVQTLVDRARPLLQAFTGGDPAVARALEAALADRHARAGALAASHGAMTEELWQYWQRAMGAERGQKP